MLYSYGGVVVTSSHKGTDFYFDCASNQVCKFTALLLRTAVLGSACVGDAGG